jgi:hypothetical protein
MSISNHFHTLSHFRVNNPYPLYSLSRRLINKVLSLPSDIACEVNSTKWFEQSVLWPRYQGQLAQHKAKLPILHVSDLEIVKELEQEGISITSLDTLNIPGSHSLVEAAQVIAVELAEQSKLPSYVGKHTLMATANQLLAHPEILCWGLSERILKIVECYLGLPVGYGGLSFYHSVADGRDAGPRIWHRDKEDWKMIKVGVYLNDVDESGGPFQCVKPAPNAWLVETLPKYKGLSHSDLEHLLKMNFPDWLTSCTGKVGTVFFVDTSRCYHRGKPPLNKDRAAIFFHYFSYRPKNPFYCDRSPLSSKQISDFNKQLPLHLQSYMNWRDKCPGLGRYIPNNQMRVDNW